MSGVKYDLGKPRPELISSIAMEELSKVLGHGADKYGDHNWRGGLVYSRLLGASLRHIFAFLRGEDLDPESGLSHIAHAMANMMFILEFLKTRSDLDDRYKG